MLSKLSQNGAAVGRGREQRLSVRLWATPLINGDVLLGSVHIQRCKNETVEILLKRVCVFEKEKSENLYYTTCHIAAIISISLKKDNSKQLVRSQLIFKISSVINFSLTKRTFNAFKFDYHFTSDWERVEKKNKQGKKSYTNQNTNRCINSMFTLLRNTVFSVWALI